MDNLNESAKIGLSAELIVALYLTELGAIVSKPFEHTTSYDFIVDYFECLTRVQVKSAQFVPRRKRRTGWGDRARHLVPLASHMRRGTSRPHVRYTPASFDVLAVVCEDDVYFLPMAALVTESGEVLRRLELKRPETETDRRDSRQASARWAQYLDNTGCFMGQEAV